jgi:hypothetical protein
MIFSMALESANRSLTPNELLRGLQRVGQLPETTEGQRVGDQIKAAFVFARADFVNVLQLITFQWTLLSP